MSNSQFQPVTEAELLAVEGGGIISFLTKVVNAVERVLRCTRGPCT
jgi:hypothetical protein